MRFLNSRNLYTGLIIHNSFKNFPNISFKFRFVFEDEKTPTEKERLNSSDKLFEILLLSNVKIFVGILLRPIGFKESRDKMMFYQLPLWKKN